MDYMVNVRDRWRRDTGHWIERIDNGDESTGISEEMEVE